MDSIATKDAHDLFSRLRSKANEIHVLYAKATGAGEPKHRTELMFEYQRLQVQWDDLYRELKKNNHEVMQIILDRLQKQGETAR